MNVRNKLANGTKSMIRDIFFHLGYDIRKLSKNHLESGWHLPPGYDPFRDMRRLVGPTDRPLIFDAGANWGQSIENFLRHFERPIIHSFEPDTDAFSELQRRFSGVPDLHLNPLALGAQCGSGLFLEH